MPAWLVPMLFLGTSASLSNFGGAVALGILPLSRRHRYEVMAIFFAMELVMPIAGIISGSRVAGAVGAAANVVAGLVLMGIGVYTILETRREARDLTVPVRRRTVVLLAFALSLDNLVVGFGLGLLGTPLLAAATFMPLASLGLTIVGLEIGRRLGNRAGERAEIFSGLVLLGAGLYVLLRG